MKITITILLIASVSLMRRAFSNLQSYLALRRWRWLVLHSRRDRSRG